MLEFFCNRSCETDLIELVSDCSKALSVVNSSGHARDGCKPIGAVQVP